MPLILRTVKGSKLTFEELDGNFQYLDSQSLSPISASYALTASYAVSASYEINYETSSSYAETSGTSVSASYSSNSSNLNGLGSVSFATTGSNTFIGNQTISGSLIVTGGITGSNGISPTTGSWTLSPGANTVSFTVTAGQSYVMWVNGNIPAGIVNWNATVTLSNTNVPAIGVQYGWYYLAGNALVLTSIPSQIVGTAGGIITTSPAVSNTNTFTFGITNNTVSSQTVYYGYTKIS